MKNIYGFQVISRTKPLKLRVSYAYKASILVYFLVQGCIQTY